MILLCEQKYYIRSLLFLDGVKAESAVNSVSYSVSASSLCSSNAADNSITELLPQQIKTVTDDFQHSVSSAFDQLDRSAVDDTDDIIESSSPLRRDADDDAGMLSTSFVVPLTTTDATACHSVIPPALSSLPSLMQLSRQALDSRADRSRDELSLKNTVSCSMTSSSAAADMFSEDDEQNDSIAEMTEVTSIDDFRCTSL